MIEWSSCGQLLIIASYDDNIRIFNTYTWNLIVNFEHEAILSNENLLYKGCNVFTESDVPTKDVDEQILKELTNIKDTHYEVNLNYCYLLCLIID